MSKLAAPEAVAAAAAGAQSGAQALVAAQRDMRAAQLGTAGDHAAAAEAAGQAAGDAALLADAATLLARISRRQRRLDAALSDSLRALNTAMVLADPARECRARVEHTHTLDALGLVEAALEEGYNALRVAELSGEPACEAAAAGALAIVHWSMSRWPDAQAGFQRMLDIGTATGDLDVQMVAQGGLGGALAQAMRDVAPAVAAPSLLRARKHAQAYLALATQLGDVHGMRAARHNHAVSLMALGDRTGARAALEAVLADATDTETRALSLRNLGDIDVQEGKAADAVQRLEEAHRLLVATEEPMYLMGCCHALCEAYEALGDAATALAWHRRFHTHYVRISSQKSQMHAKALAVRHETGRAQAVAAFERLRAQRFERDAMQDSLTGIANRRAFDHVLAQAINAAGQGRSFGLALLDIDNFKHINDLHSHQVGDAVLQRVGQILATHARRDDVAARYGGEEFALVLAGADADSPRLACERVRSTIEVEDWSAMSPGLVVRISAGCLHVDADLATVGADVLLARADRRLYAAKVAGRNRVVSADDPRYAGADGT